MVNVSILGLWNLWAAERVIQNEQFFFENMLKYEIDQLKTKSTASFAKPTDIDAKQTIIDAKPTVIHWINVRWRAKRYQEKSYPRKNVARRKHDYPQIRLRFSCEMYMYNCLHNYIPWIITQYRLTFFKKGQTHPKNLDKLKKKINSQIIKNIIRLQGGR